MTGHGDPRYRTELEELAERVARYLPGWVPGPWRPLAPHGGEHPDALLMRERAAGAPYRLSLQYGAPDTLIVSGEPPDNRCRWQPMLTSMPASLDPEVIASCIGHALLPTYLITFDTAAAESRAGELLAAQDRAARTAVLDMLTVVLPRPAKTASVDETGATLRWWSGGTDTSPVGTGTVSINADGTEVRLDIRYLTPDAAYRVLRELQEGADQ
jgi:hypothetical protein